MKTVLITGATSGIGQQTALTFSKQEWQVIACGRNQAALEDLTSKLNSKSVALPLDLSDPKVLTERIKEIITQLKLEKLDLLINNAGIVKRKAYEEHKLSDFEEQLQVNFLAPALLSQKLIPLLKKAPKAQIINVSSNLGERSIPLTSVYSATKSALNSLTKSLALELAPFGIRVNAICPGIVNTPIHQLEGLDNKNEIIDQMNQLTPLGRIGTPEELAEYIYLYTTKAFLWKTGAIDIIDGGIILS